MYEEFKKAIKEAELFPKETFVVEFRNITLNNYGGESAAVEGKNLMSCINKIKSNNHNRISNIYKVLYNSSLKLPDSIEIDTRDKPLVGYDFGKYVYDTQVKEKIDLSRDVVLVFRGRSLASSSFAQGFMESIIKEIGLSAAEERITIIAGFSVDNFWKSLL